MNQQQVQDLSAEQEPHRPFLQRIRTSKKWRTASFIFAIIVFIAVYIAAFLTQSISNQSSQLQKTVFTPEEVVSQTLLDENVNGWDAQYHGILVNWQRDDLSRINCSDVKCDVRGISTRHDSTNDLRDLENLYWYRTRHPNDPALNGYIARILPTVKQEWGNTTTPKGWLYYTLLRMVDYSDDSAYWLNTLKHWVAAQYQGLDPVLGVHHGPLDTVASTNKFPIQDGYRVDLALETGLALTDAGTRFQHPEWVTAGHREVNVVIHQAFDTKYHLFNRIYLIYDSRYGSNKVYDYQARMGENGQEVEALMRAGLYTGTTAYTELAKEILDSLVSLPLHDRINGGFYFKIFLGPFLGEQAGFVDKTVKETRQLHMLPALHLANLAFHNRWAGLESELLRLATTAHKLFLPAPVPGFTYQILPGGNLYPCATCSPSHFENWDTSEADNIAIEGLQTIIGDKSMPNP